MKALLAADASDRFRIYLNDHRGLLAAERALADRSHEANRDTALGDVLRDVVRQVAADQAVIDGLLDRVDGIANPVKRIGAVLGERFGRLKLNGQLSGYSPLSRVIEVEALLASTSMRRAMWSAVAAIAIDDDVTIDAAMRAQTAADQHQRLAQQHAGAVQQALDATG